MKTYPFRYISFLLLLFISFPTHAGELKFEWKIPEGKVLKYEVLTNSDQKLDVLVDATGEHEQQQKEFYGEDNYSNGKVSVEGSGSTIVTLEGLDKNRIRAKSIINNISSNAKPSFTQHGSRLMAGLVITDIIFNEKNMGRAVKQTEEDAQANVNEFNVAALEFPLNILYSMPKNLNNVGDTEKLDIPCIRLRGYNPTKHEKSGQIKFKSIKVDEKNHEIATLNYSYDEIIEIKNDAHGLFENEAEYIRHSCRVNLSGHFDLTSGIWVVMKGALIHSGERVTGTVSFTVSLTDKVPPKEISTAEFQKEVFEDSAKRVELCAPENPENDSAECIEDPIHRWKQLKEEQKQRELNPNKQKTETPIDNTQGDCGCIDPDKTDSKQGDPLSRWKYSQCLKNCEKHIK